jgi:hypothetical protein
MGNKSGATASNKQGAFSTHVILADNVPREIYCQQCGDFEPLREDDPYMAMNQDQWFDLVCGKCMAVVTTVRIKALSFVPCGGTVQ